MESSGKKQSSFTLRGVSVLLLTTGLITNAVYISALYYYKGLVAQLGFDSELFPITWADTTFWAYTASRQLGASYISGLTNYLNTALSVASILLLLVIVYFVARLIMFLFKPKINKTVWNSYDKIQPMRKFVEWRKKRPIIVKITFPIFK